MTLVQKEVKSVYIGIPHTENTRKGPCADGFHVPTWSEWATIIQVGVDLGMWAWSGSSAGDIKAYLKLPFAGNRTPSGGAVNAQGSAGFYWSCGIGSGGTGRLLYATSSSNTYSDQYRTLGGSIRPFKDTPVTPDGTWTVIGAGSGGSGIYQKASLGLISLSSDGNTRYTIADKNLGATSVWSYGDTVTAAKCGNYYQWGNNYGFPWTGSITTSSTRVDTSAYGAGNYYSSSTYITYNGDWSNPANNDLWGYSTGEVVYPDTSVKSVYIGSTKVRPIDKRTFTITWTETSSPTSFNPTYSDDAAGLTAGSTAFDEFFGYYGCRLSNAGVETATVQQSSPGILDITQLGTLTSGDNVMIAFPRRGIKMSKSGAQVTLSITADPNKSGYQYYAHTKGSDAKDTLYLGTYKMNSGYESLSGQAPLVKKTRATVRSGIKFTYDGLAGTNRYSQITIYPRWFISALYMMKYGNPNSQSVIGQGYTGGSAAVNTGGTNSQTSASYGTSSSTVQCKLFGLEDWWGNVFEWMDGCYLNSSTQLTVDKTNNVFKDSDYSTNLGTASSSWLSGIDGSSDGMFRNVNTSGGSGTTYYTDYSAANASRVLFAGGSWAEGAYSGVFYGSSYSASSASIYFGSRLMYL